MWKTPKSSPQKSLLEKVIRNFCAPALAGCACVAPGRMRKPGKSGKSANGAEALQQPSSGKTEKMESRGEHGLAPLQGKKGKDRPIAPRERTKKKERASPSEQKVKTGKQSCPCSEDKEGRRKKACEQG
jgi:hypothetical protein